MKIEEETVDVVVTSLRDVPGDLRRVLKVQFKEFIHMVEDQMADASSHLSSSAQIIDIHSYWTEKRIAS